jgi:large repetitive protein
MLIASLIVAPQASAATSIGVKFVTKPKTSSNSTTAKFSWTTHGPVLRTVCALDRGRFVKCSGSRTIKRLKNGLHTFLVKAIGATSTWTATYRWRVDTIAPTAPSAIGGSTAWQSVASIAISAAGSTDGGSGLAGYQRRSSVDGGATWSLGTAGAQVSASADGETLVQFRALDRAGNASAWSPAAGTAGATAHIDRDAPSAPVVAGGSLQWQNAFSVDVTGTGSADVGGAGLDHYEYRTSTDGGLTWSVGASGSDVAIIDDGETLVQFRAVDAAGNASDWAPLLSGDGNTVMLDRTIPTAPTVAGSTSGWENIAGTTLTASGSLDALGSGVAGYESRSSTDGGGTWTSPTSGNSIAVSAEGETLVEFRAVDFTNLNSAWTQVAVRIDRTNPSDPSVAGGSTAWQSVVSLDIAASGSSDAGGSGLTGYELRTSTDGGSTWTSPVAGSHDLVTGEGETLVELRAVDGAGNVSAWVQDTARIDRSAPTLPTVSGGSLSWQSRASVDVTATGSTDAGGSTLTGYEYRTSTDGGSSWSVPVSGAIDTVSAEGETLVEFRVLDGAGNASAWTPSPSTAEGAVRLDRTAPTLSSVSGGSLTWKNQASETVTAVGGADTGGSGFAGYEYRTSTDGGSIWSGAGAGSSLVVSAQGETLLQFRAIDGAGNSGAWVPAGPGAGDTVRLDRTAPTAPTIAGGSPLWQSVASASLTASGSTDGASGVASYQYRTSTDGGTTWSATSSGAAVMVSGQGTTTVAFRAVDGVGLVSAWVTDSVKIDRTVPGSPSVSGGSGTWRSVASVSVTASNGTDTGGSNVAGYRFQTSTDGGSTWSVPASGSGVSVSGTGETLVRFRTVDGAGNESPWAPSSGTSGTVRIDRTVPTDPTVSGGSLAWQSVASVTLSAAGSTDSGGASLSGYQSRTSTDAGATWSAAVSGASFPVAAEGETLVEFRAIDGAGNTSAWVQAVARLDRTAPGTPTVSGGSLSWQNVASVSISASAATDTGGSGVSGYELRASTDGGTTWSAPASGASDAISAEGQTLVQLRTVDGAGNRSAWKPASAGASNTVRIDRTAPTAPSVAGGSLAWQSVASVLVTASGSSDSPGSGVSGYQSQTSIDNGVTWSSAIAGASASVSAQGETLVRFAAVDAAGFVSATTQATVRIDRTAPSAPTVSGGSLSWQNVATMTVTASGSTDSGGSALSGYEYRASTDNGTTWSAAVAGASDVVGSEGQTLVQLRSVDGAGNASAWTPAASGASNTVRIDRTAPGLPVVSGGSTAWQSVASIATSAAGAGDPGGGGVTGYEYRTSIDAGSTWSSPLPGASLAVSAEGETLVGFRSVDAAGNRSAWVQATARIDRTAPTAPSVSGGSLSWQNVASLTISAAGSTDSGGSLLTGYRYRASVDGGVTWTAATAGASDLISPEGATLVQFQSLDGAGNSSAWTPAVSGAGNTARIDRALPVAPTSVTGGSLSWQSVASVTITPAGGSDSGSGFAGYDYRTSTDGGTTWSLKVAGNSLAVSAEGTTLVQFRSRDVAGNVSAWTPASPGAGNTAAIDRTVPTAPTVTGGSLSWQAVASVTISAAGSTDATSGLLRFEYRSSTNGGSTWSAITTGPSASISQEATTIVQFRAVDNAGNVSAWAPASAGAGNTVKLDRTAPTLPTVSGGQGAGTCKKHLTLSASNSTDALSGFAHYDYRYSTDGGTTWSAAVTGQNSFTPPAKGTYVVQFRAVDAVGNTSTWAPAVAGSANTACIS